MLPLPVVNVWIVCLGTMWSLYVCIKVTFWFYVIRVPSSKFAVASKRLFSLHCTMTVRFVKPTAKRPSWAMDLYSSSLFFMMEKVSLILNNAPSHCSNFKVLSYSMMNSNSMVSISDLKLSFPVKKAAGMGVKTCSSAIRITNWNTDFCFSCSL